MRPIRLQRHLTLAFHNKSHLQHPGGLEQGIEVFLCDLDLSGVDEGGEVAQRGGRDVGQEEGRVVAGAVAEQALEFIGY